MPKLPAILLALLASGLAHADPTILSMRDRADVIDRWMDVRVGNGSAGIDAAG